MSLGLKGRVDTLASSGSSFLSWGFSMLCLWHALFMLFDVAGKTRHFRVLRSWWWACCHVEPMFNFGYDDAYVCIWIYMTDVDASLCIVNTNPNTTKSSDEIVFMGPNRLPTLVSKPALSMGFCLTLNLK